METFKAQKTKQKMVQTNIKMQTKMRYLYLQGSNLTTSKQYTVNEW